MQLGRYLVLIKKTMRYALLIFLTILFESCDTATSKSLQAYDLPQGYALERMEKILLPGDLEEISGIAWHDGELFAIEDESSIIYHVDPKTGKILSKKKFEKNRDIEDILVRNDTAWVLRSNGNLYQVVNFKEKESQTTIYEFPKLGKRDMEAAVSDSKTSSILVFCKVCEWDLDPGRFSYFKFDLKTLAFDSIPAGKIERSLLDGLLPDKSLEKLKLQPSAAAIHPLTQDYYLLSSTGKWLMTLGRDWTPKTVHLLSKALFRQPEGMTFAQDGTLFISNEADDGRANILIFSYQP